MCGTPAQRKPERPVFQPRDRGEVFWNTALLSIEQTSSLLQHEYEYKVSDITMNNIGSATLRQPRLLYTSSITTWSSGTTTGSGTTNVDDGLQSTGTLAGTFILAREHGNNTKQASNPGTTCKLAWHARSVHWMYLQAHNNQKHSRQTTAWQLQAKQELSWDHQKNTWHEQHEHNTARTIWSWHEHMNIILPEQ